MSYRAGVGPGLSALGLEPGPPRITCDGCGLVLNIRDGRPPAWLLDGKAPKGWKLTREGEKRTDYCPTCKAAKRAESERRCQCPGVRGCQTMVPASSPSALCYPCADADCDCDRQLKEST